MSGHIHFVTPTNRWIGSIPLSTIDPLTLEPLSTYLRPGPPDGDKLSQNGATMASDFEDNEYKDRRTNLSGKLIVPQSLVFWMATVSIPNHRVQQKKTGQPISLILARLQTTPQGCSCGCTVPAPPKHSDYYHAQHLLQLIFQTQRIRSRALRAHLPQYFEPPLPGEEQQEEQERENILPLNTATQPPPEITSVVSVTEDQDQGIPSTTVPIEPASQGTQCAEPLPPLTKPKIPQYVHSLIQNRSLKNPLTNTDVEGDPMFFAVLEPGCGGWWFEPWAMVIRPAGVVRGIDPRFRYHPQQSQHQEHHPSQSTSSEVTNEKTAEKTPEIILEEKELRKEKWRQARLATLEVEAQHELEWRRWRRSIILAPRSGTSSSSSSARRRRRPLSRTAGLAENATSESWRRLSCPRLMRYKLGKDIAVLEPSERALRLPKRVKTVQTGGRTTEDNLVDGKASPSTEEDMSKDTRLTSAIHASAALDEVELEEIRQHQTLSEAEIQIPSPLENEDGKLKSPALDTKHELRSSKRRDRYTTVHHQELRTMPWWDPDPEPLKMPKTGLSPFAISTLPAPVAKRFGGVSMYQPPEPPLSSSSSQASASDAIEDKERALEENCDTDGCKWVPVQTGDRVAVMIGSSKDFMLFPSFQRLLFRHLSREDFEDRAGCVGVIPHPASLAFATHPGGNGNRQNTGRETTAQGPLTMDQRRGSAQGERAEQDSSRDEYEQPRPVDLGIEERSRSWLPWRRRTGSTVNRATTVVSLPSEQVDMEGSAGSASAEPNHGCPDTSFDKTANADSTRTPDTGETTEAKQRESRTPLTQFDEKVHETQLELYFETFEREDYDSSEYSFGSSSDEAEDMLALDIDAGYDSSDVSDSSEDEDDREDSEREAAATPSRSCSWSRLFCCCFSSSAETIQARSRRSRASERRQARRERWRRQRQLRYLQQESPVILRYLPASVQRRIGTESVVRCWQMSEFCRFYLTILMAIALMGAIVYGAVHAESMPSKGPLSSAASSPTIRDRRGQSRGNGETQTVVNAVDFDSSSISSLVSHIPVEWTPRKHQKDQALLSRRGSCAYHRDVRRNKKGKQRTVSSGQ